ncbi:hypothetical protein H257_19365 [Aphanomyces astaci]|uniref:Uncharacterized protein n=2 Tax=Aphanomyces astaci TaxID=112090 RepID=W4F8B9_APHAT|nr:hypothetical protein H257_19363 [Aphanomyces astaci]XP_009846813.1 hypothetical protein H257_19365 [Aphanomyces astaci]ETV63702.1 hypothetical protein H257_19365 [Aphanomyces astaci]ETV63704.1 hypothetical protein H257_19363 [Aphanomyces astaci]|eukprot:XP_009846811.1 hypothetical protein H257_19363 [Aphanomyces astaci]
MPPRKSRPSKGVDLADRTPSKRVLWTKDSVGDGKSSMDVVIAWMSVETNYVRWKGGDKHSGSTKASLAAEVVERLANNGIHHRTTKDVVQKIGDVERSYRTACDWLANTGQGIVDEDSIRKEVQRLCPYYYSLDEVMRDRASTAPIVTSENMNEASSDEDVPSTPEAPSSASKKRTAAAAKLDDWTEINARAYALKRQQLEFTRDVEERKLQVDMQREARLAEETKLNVRLLTIQADEAHWKFELAREAAAVDARIKKIQTRKDLKERGWSDADIDMACPI